MNTRQKKALYESIMKNVSKQVKKTLNEGNVYLINSDGDLEKISDIIGLNLNKYSRQASRFTPRKWAQVSEFARIFVNGLKEEGYSDDQCFNILMALLNDGRFGDNLIF